MSVQSFPFTSIDGDRKITAFQEAQGFNLFVGSGVVEPSAGYLGTALRVSKVSGTMNVSVAQGSAIVLGHRYIQTGAEVLTLDAGGAKPRIDVVVVEANRENSVRACRLAVVKGEEADVPEAPALTETETQYQIPLYWVGVPASATTLNSATFTDKREPSRPRGISTEAQEIVDRFAYKLPVIAATTEAITLSGEQTIDGVSAVEYDRVLVKNQADAEENGIYLVAAGAWARANDFDADEDAIPGSLVHIERGTANGGQLWRLTTSGPIEIGVTELAFARLDTVAAGDGLQNVDDVVSMRTPGTLTLETTNAVDETGHTHELDIDIPTYIYKCTGTDDNDAITAIVNGFLAATGIWAGTTARTLKLVVMGDVGIPENEITLFPFSSTQTRGARVIIDWSDARGLDLDIDSSAERILFNHTNVGCRITHVGLNFSIANDNAADVQTRGIAANTGADVVIKDSRMLVEGRNATGVYATGGATIKLIDCEIYANSVFDSNIAGNYARAAKAFDGGKVVAERCILSGIASNAGTYATAGGTVGAAVHVEDGGEASLLNCDLLGEGDAVSAYGIGINVPTQTDVFYSVYANGCRIRGYTNDALGYGVIAFDGVNGVIRLLNCSFPTVALSGYEQTGAIKLEGTTAGAAYLIANNVFAGANSSPNIVKHSDSDPADNYAMTGNMFGVNLG